MSLTNTPSSERVHIGFFGLRNAGKSSLVNAVTNQELSVVSDVLGTTTDPVKKAMELLPIGAVVIIDTPGFDDVGTLGELRVRKTRKVLASVDIAVLVVDAEKGISDDDKELIELFKERKIPYIIAYNKADLAEIKTENKNEISVSAKDKKNIEELKELIGTMLNSKKEKYILADLVDRGDTVVLVTPIDESAPKGRLILPQQQTLRELLDLHCKPVLCQPSELKSTLENFKEKPKLVITDSQVFGIVSKDVPEDINLTSFSILFARYKGDLDTLVKGAAALKNLKDGDKVLISEGCTHHRQCGDIGTVKLPKWIKDYTKKEVEFAFTSGGDFPEDLSDYALVVHCGGCMLNNREMEYRLNMAKAEGVAMVNYGVLIAHIHGILKKSLSPFKNLTKLLED
ncbi:MAG: [FeFe] hydrogenase H-cluster maturation GTPase HydF [Ruminococcaceae bacterium]|nr:[FeFe] hydrogenase H-cluster maturation GTPase HydF [Oscillospiraceae bacterium]